MQDNDSENLENEEIKDRQKKNNDYIDKPNEEPNKSTEEIKDTGLRLKNKQ